MQNKLSFSSILGKISGFLKKQFSSTFGATLLAIGLGLIVGLIVMLFTDPAHAFAGFTQVLFGGFNNLGQVIYFATPILMTGLAVGFAFKMGLFNIGASNQYTMGMYFALYVAFMWELPSSIHWIVAVLAGMVGGMIMGAIPGILKAFLNVNEVITSIMMNYIGLYLVDMWISNNSKMYVSTRSVTAYIPQSVQMPSLGIANSNASVGIIIAVVIAILLAIVLNKTTFGFELKATGYNKFASHYAGINYKRNTVLTMVIAGGLAGLGGALAILAPSTIAGSSVTYAPINVIAINGFNGIAVALLGASSPIGIIFSSLFISFIQRGGSIAGIFGNFKPDIIDVVISVIIYFSAFAIIMSSFVGKYFKKRRQKKEEELNQATIDPVEKPQDKEA